MEENQAVRIIKDHADALRIVLEKVQAVATRYLVPDGISAEQAMAEILALTDNTDLAEHQMAVLNYAPGPAKLVLDLTGGCLQSLSCTVPVDLIITSSEREDIADATPIRAINCLSTFRGDVLIGEGDDAVAARIQLDAAHGTAQDAIDTFALFKR